MGVCLPGANNVMSRTHLKKGCAHSLSLSRPFSPSLSLSLPLSCRHGLRLHDAPPLESCVRSDKLTLPMNMHCCLFSRAAMSDYPNQQQIEMFLINRGNAPTYTSCVRMERFAKWVADSPHIAIRNW